MLDDSEKKASGKVFRPLYDIPHMYEAREFLRKKLIDQKVHITVDYIQPAQNNYPEKTCCTIKLRRRERGRGAGAARAGHGGALSPGRRPARPPLRRPARGRGQGYQGWPRPPQQEEGTPAQIP